MKQYTIESRVSRIETVEVKATDSKSAVQFVKDNPHLFWKRTSEDETRELISIS